MKHLLPNIFAPKCPRSWQAVRLGQFLRLQALTEHVSPAEEEAWQIAILCNLSYKNVVRLAPQQAAARKAALRELLQHAPQSPPLHTIQWGNARYGFTDDLGDQPLGWWIALEQALFRPPGRLAALQQGQLHNLPDVLAVCLVPEDGFNQNRLALQRRMALDLPLPMALGLLNGLLARIVRLQAQYPMLFEGDAGDGPLVEYYTRWGWQALLAEINGGQLPPAARQAWLQAPTHLAFQELARRNDWAGAQRRELARRPLSHP